MKKDDRMIIIAVIPVFNEEKTIGMVVRETKKYADKVIVLDDGSKDNSASEAGKNGALVIRQIVNMGKGFSLRTGCEKALLEGADVIVTLDGDGQHSPDDIPKLVKTLEKEKLDIVLGSRLLDKNMPHTKKFGNWLLNSASKFFFAVDVKDTQSGFKVFTKKAYEKIRWDSKNYAVESEIIMRIGKRKLKYKELPIRTIYEDKYKGTTALDGIKIFLNMLWWRLMR
jgi:glycosyltransferase involved in cell wall biosynthesis